MVLDRVIMQKSLELRVWGSREFQPAQCVLQGSLVVPRVCDCSPGCRGAEGFSCAGLLQRWDQNRLMMFLKKRIYLKFTCKYLLHTLCKTAEIKLPPACFNQYSKDCLSSVKLRKCHWMWPWRISHRGCALDFVLQLVIAHLSKIWQQMDSIFLMHNTPLSLSQHLILLQASFSTEPCSYDQ